MPAYLSQRVGRNLRVGIRIGGGRKAGNQSSETTTLVISLLIAGIIGGIVLLIQMYWIALLIGFFLFTFVTISIAICAANSEEKELARALGKEAQQHIHRINPHQPLEISQGECALAIERLQELKNRDSCERVVANAEETLNQLLAIQKTLEIGYFLRDIEYATFHGNVEQLRTIYVDVVFLCHCNQISDQEIKLAGLRDNQIGENITLDYLISKATDLGWNPPSEEFNFTHTEGVSNEFMPLPLPVSN